MSLKGMVNEDTLNSRSRYPERWHRHKQMLFRCFKLVAFAGDKNDIRILAGGDGTDEAAVRSAAFNMERAAHGKLIEFVSLVLLPAGCIAVTPLSTLLCRASMRALTRPRNDIEKIISSRGWDISPFSWNGIRSLHGKHAGIEERKLHSLS